MTNTQRNEAFKRLGFLKGLINSSELSLTDTAKDRYIAELDTLNRQIEIDDAIKAFHERVTIPSIAKAISPFITWTVIALFALAIALVVTLSSCTKERSYESNCIEITTTKVRGQEFRSDTVKVSHPQPDSFIQVTTDSVIFKRTLCD